MYINLIRCISKCAVAVRLLDLSLAHIFYFSSPVAMSHLNGQKVFGKVMRVTLSKHQTVALPREGLDDQLLTKGKRMYSSWKGAFQYL